MILELIFRCKTLHFVKLRAVKKLTMTQSPTNLRFVFDNPRQTLRRGTVRFTIMVRSSMVLPSSGLFLLTLSQFDPGHRRTSSGTVFFTQIWDRVLGLLNWDVVRHVPSSRKFTPQRNVPRNLPWCAVICLKKKFFNFF